jgi:hypothetical protein
MMSLPGIEHGHVNDHFEGTKLYWHSLGIESRKSSFAFDEIIDNF